MSPFAVDSLANHCGLQKLPAQAIIILSMIFLQIFQERMTLIKKWYAAWNESQRWTLLEYILRQQDDDKLEVIHDLLHPVLPPPDHDFTCVLPRFLCLKIFALLDPQSLCRAAQVVNKINNRCFKHVCVLFCNLPSSSYLSLSLSLSLSLMER